MNQEISCSSRGERLIFIISQPRSGSTMLQRILFGHTDIHATAEPWMMLHPLYALRSHGMAAEFGNVEFAHAFGDFLDTLPNGRAEYEEAVRRMCWYLYARALDASGKKLFLDKTPRYYLIIPELKRIFPDAKFIVLLRNPIAVMTSILTSWIREDWFRLYGQNERLLVNSPRLLAEGIQVLGDAGLVVRYESLVSNPESEVSRVCDFLGVEFTPNMLNYGGNEPPEGTFGDRYGVDRHEAPVDQASTWQASLVDGQIWKLLHDYLQLLSPRDLAALGYAYDDLVAILEQRRPSRFTSGAALSLRFLMSKPPEQRRRWENMYARISRRLTRSK